MVLSDRRIQERLAPSNDPGKRLYVLPMESLEIQSTAASIDVHLGQEFLWPRRTSAGYLDAAAESPENIPCRSMGAVGPDSWGDVLDRVCVPIDGEFLLHPGQFALGAVFEFIKLPLDLCADVVGRSSWARVGLIIAMATFVHPGYAGCLTLELQNLGEVPIRLQPGMRVAQVVFREIDEIPHQPAGQIVCSYGPQYWPVVSESDRKLLRALQDA